MSNERALIFRQGWKNFCEIGTLFQCSNSATSQLAEFVRLYKSCENGIIVELGSGPGKVTEAILKQIGPSQKILAFETNYPFCQHLEQKFPEEINQGKLQVINDCASNLEEYLESAPHCIISILPLAIRKNFPEDFKEDLFRKVYKNLSLNGTFAQFQYLVARTIRREDFNRSKRIFGNVSGNYAPPFGWIYSSKKIQENKRN